MPADRTVPTPAGPAPFLAALAAPKRAEAERLDAIFRAATGRGAWMRGSAILGYGRYRYGNEGGREALAPATAFAPRAHGFSVYIMPGDAELGDLLAALGRHRIGKSCLEIRRLSDIDEDVPGRLIAAGVERLGRRWPIAPA